MPAIPWSLHWQEQGRAWLYWRLHSQVSSWRAAVRLQPVSAPGSGGREIVDRTIVSSCFHHVIDCESLSGLDKPRPPEQNLQRRTKSETASAAPVSGHQPRRSLKSFRGVLCLPQWFPLRRPGAALLSLTLTRRLRCARLPASIVAIRRKPRNLPSPAFNQPSKINHQKSSRRA